jgi:transposase InsO family protein
VLAEAGVPASDDGLPARLAHLAEPGAPIGPDGRQPAVGGRYHLRPAEAFIYLAVVLDAFSRKVIGWAMADHLQASLVLEALQMALDGREVIPGGLVHHSDSQSALASGSWAA